MTIKRFEDLLCWQPGRELNKELFKHFGQISNYGFRDQLLRASLSITNNIAEGFERRSDKELRQFLVIARGSNSEVRSMLYTALDIGYLEKNMFIKLMDMVIRIGKLLTAFIKTLNPAQPSNHQTIKTIQPI